MGNDLETHLSPRAALGLTGLWGSLLIEARAGLLVFEDEYLESGTDAGLYDSGRFALGLGVGWRRPS
jgi:hypothetical protein